jgi:hypothetical protein
MFGLPDEAQIAIEASRREQTFHTRPAKLILMQRKIAMHLDVPSPLDPSGFSIRVTFPPHSSEKRRREQAGH